MLRALLTMVLVVLRPLAVQGIDPQNVTQVVSLTEGTFRCFHGTDLGRSGDAARVLIGDSPSSAECRGRIR